MLSHVGKLGLAIVPLGWRLLVFILQPRGPADWKLCTDALSPQFYPAQSERRAQIAKLCFIGCSPPLLIPTA